MSHLHLPSGAWLRLVCLILSVFVARVRAQDLVASLDYGTFQGAYSRTYNVSYWQKIPFAAPPVGENRFRVPQPPIPLTNGTYDSSQPFDMCPQRTVNGSEDCLYLGLYSRPWTRGQALRPVVVVFYGGGFIQGSAYFTLPPPAYPVLNVSASADLVFVYPNYRVNAFGFLPGREIAADPMSDLNPGLLDQRAALRWTRSYIQHFGGDPYDVSIWGQSAGGGSVVAQVIAREDASPPLFRKALASSPYWPRTYRHDAPEAQRQYDALANMTGCANNPASKEGGGTSGSGRGTLACLKAVDVQTIRVASLAIAGSHTYDTSSYTWGPVIDGTFLTRPLSSVGETRPEAATGSGGGQVSVNSTAALAAFGMYNTHEGENFVPPGLRGARDSGSPPFNSSTASFDAWLQGFLPSFTRGDLETVRQLYPPATTGGGPISSGGSDDGSETLVRYNDSYTRAGLIYRDLVLACPAYWMAGAAAAVGGGWLGEYSISPAKHASDTYWWNRVNSAQQTDSFHYEGYTGAFASFFATGDPNAMKLTNASTADVPALGTGREFNINAAGFADLGLAEFEKRCAFWKSAAPRVPV